MHNSCLLLLFLPFIHRIQTSPGQITVAIDGDWRHHQEYFHLLGRLPSAAHRFQLNLHKNIGTPQHKMLSGQSIANDALDEFTFSDIPQDWFDHSTPIEDTHDRKRKRPMHEENLIDLEIILASTILSIWRHFRIDTLNTVYRVSILPTHNLVISNDEQIDVNSLDLFNLQHLANRMTKNYHKLEALKHLTNKDHDHLVQRVLLSLERVDLREAQFPKQTVYRRSPVTPEMMAAKKIEFQREREELLKGYAKDKGKQTAEQTAEQKRQRVTIPMSMGGVTVEGSSSSRVAAGNQASQTRPSQMEYNAENPNVLPLTHLKETSVFIPHQQQQQLQSGKQQQPPLSHTATMSLLKNMPFEHRKSILEETLKNYFATTQLLQAKSADAGSSENKGKEAVGQSQMMDVRQLHMALTNAMPKTDERSSVQNPTESQKTMGQNASMFSILESHQQGNLHAQDGGSSASGSNNKGKQVLSTAKLSPDPNWLFLGKNLPSGESDQQSPKSPMSNDGANEADEDAEDVDLTLSLTKKPKKSD